jgi:hypothetical protein
MRKKTKEQAMRRVLLLICLASQLGTSVAKEVEILTNDNELLIIEHLKSNVAAGQSNSHTVMQNSRTGLVITQLNEHNHTSERSSRVLVRVAYSRSSRNRNETKNTQVPTLAAAQPKLIYISIDNQNPCVRHTCKSNQICVPRPINQTSINYECVARPAKPAHLPAQVTQKIQLKRRVRSALSATPKTILLTKGCSMNEFVETQLLVRELLHSSVDGSRFEFVDSNHDSFVSPHEVIAALVRHASQKLNRVCIGDLFTNLKRESKKLILNRREIEYFLVITAPKCSLIRGDSSSSFKDFYVKHLNEKLSGAKRLASAELVKSNDYVPICDEEGYFAASQCDGRVTCWCVSRLGEAVTDSARRISQTPIDCKLIVKKMQ